MPRPITRSSTGRLLLCAVLASLVLVSASRPVAAEQNCGIGLGVRPTEVLLPWNAIPAAGGTTFAVTLNVNYSSSFTNHTLTLQYLNGSQWKDLGSFVGNQVGFTELSHDVDSGWARFGANTVRVASGSCSSSESTFAVHYDPSSFEVDAAVYVAAAALSIAFLLLGRKLGWKRFLILAVPVYLALAPWTGQRYDLYFLLSSGIRVLQHVNPFDPGSPPVYPGPLKWAYPPLYPLYSAFSFIVYQALTGASLPSASALTYPGWLTSTYDVYLAYVPPTLPLLVALLKLPMVASAILTGLLLKRMTGKGSAAVWWIANPLVILVAAIWGQLDPIATLLALAAIYYFQRGKEYQAYLLTSLGAAVKIWPLLLIPVFFVVSLRRSGRGAVRPLLALLPALALLLAIYTLYGNPAESLFLLAYSRGIPTFAGAFSVNGLTWQEVLFVLGSPPVPVFLFVGIPAYGAILAWAYWKRESDVVKLLIVFLLVFYLTYNYVNPQYFYWILPLLMLRGRRLATMVFTALPLIYMLFAYNLFYFVSPAVLPNEFAFGASVLEQMKVSVLYQTPALFILITAVLPTTAYLTFLYKELRATWGNDPGTVTAEEVG